ncbi:MAG: VCBS repeat-containing protein [Verrucomicrobia bacterium]|nr:VCBS repeat-containing protein [Verrucomicrobiota bacterium]
MSVPTTGRSGFTQIPGERTGVLFTNVLSEAHSLTNHIVLNGSGVAAGDVDGDGWCDLYFGGLDGPNRLYRNLGDWRFEDFTAAAGVACQGQYSAGAVFADLDGDGDLDLLVSSVGHGVSGFLNDGLGHFKEATAEAGLTSLAGSMSMTLADMDGDGDLDLYVANYRTWTMRDRFNMQFRLRRVQGRPEIVMVNGRPVTEPDLAGQYTMDESGQITENGEADVLYRNDGQGRFTAVPFPGGAFLDEDGQALASPPYDWGLTAMFRDIDGDGAPDLYVCNDLASPDRIWINDGAGRFRALRRLALRKTSWFSMAVDFADVNRDGHDDFLVTDMLSREHLKRHTQNTDHRTVSLAIGEIEARPQTARNTLFLNQGDGDFAEIAYLSGLEASNWSWSSVFLDVDLDGFEDLLIATGFERDVQDVDIAKELEVARKEQKLSDDESLRIRRRFPRLATPNRAFRNHGDLTFEECARAWRFDVTGVSQGLALADLDNDGDLDVAINRLNDPAVLLRNDAPAPRVAVRLRGLPPNTRGIGARIKVTPDLATPASSRPGSAPLFPTQTKEMICGGRYLSGDDAVRVFAAGNATNRFTIEVTWRSGKTSSIHEAQANRVYEVDEAAATVVTHHAARRTTPEAKPLFQDVSHLLRHTHDETPFDDFERQPLLPRRLSQLGPGVAWHDLDRDGFDDLVIGSGRGGQLAVYRNDGQGGFKRLSEAPVTTQVTRDQTGALGWTASDGAAAIFVGSANYEDGLAQGAAARIYDLKAKTVKDGLPGQPSSSGPLALGDVDGDGDLDLFVGGRAIPGRYPEAASSLLFRQENGVWQPDRENTQSLEKIGLVSGAVFSDLDGDGLPELILACEWGPVRVFRNDRGKLQAWDQKLSWFADDSSTQHAARSTEQASTMNHLTGWWTGVTTGDFDGDGRLDIVAANWGRNTKHQNHRAQPLRLYYGDFIGNGAVDLLEGYFDEGSAKVVPWTILDRVEAALPFVRERFPTHQAYGRASVAEILGERFASARELSVNWLESTLFLNRGDHFEARALPVEAQFAPAFAVCVADFDGDGNEDVFLSQNFFATEPMTGRYDSGRGLWLRGDGRGGLTPVPARASGLRIYGEQRGAAVSDYDADGRVDLVVTQNGAETKLYRNAGARPGLRVRLVGPAGNPNGVGAAMRLISGERTGPMREIHAGSGYWSEDSAVQVMGTAGATEKLWVRWPGGKTVTANIPPGAREVAVEIGGVVRTVK